MDENVSQTTHFPAGKREIRQLIFLIVLGVLMADFVIKGGLNLGFALTAMAMSIVSFRYFSQSGNKRNHYASALFALNLLISASFLRSDDGFVKFMMVCFLLLGGNLSMALTAGQNRRDPSGLLSLLDAPRAVFTFGFGQMGNALGGLNDARKNAGSAGKKHMAVLSGLAVAAPVMAVLISLLIRADAAFEGLMGLLPETDIAEPFFALLLGIPTAFVLYARNTGLKHRPGEENDLWMPRHISSLTVNTVLSCVAAVYAVYLMSQLAYFAGGFSGILPEGFTMAEYARRGFFEMTWLAVINLGIMGSAIALAEPKNGKIPMATRVMCLLIGLVTLFFAATASGKMFLYIGSYGLTRLRILVQVIIIFIALTVTFVTVWLFQPKFPYMKAVLLTAMAIGACVSWADVDTVVAAYNVGAYQQGKLEKVDLGHLGALGSGAVPYLQELTENADPSVSRLARDILLRRAEQSEAMDLRGWNIADAKAQQLLAPYQKEADTLRQEEAELQKFLDSIQSLPVTQLCLYTDTDIGCRLLVEMLPELPYPEKSVTFTVKDRFLYDPYGEPFGACPFGYEALMTMEQVGITQVTAAESHVAFRWEQDPELSLVWTLDPHQTAALLAQTATDLQWYPVEGNWYMMKASW